MSIDERMRVVRILWGALFTSTWLFLGILFLLKRFGDVPSEPEAPLMLPIFAAVAFSLAVVSVVLPRQQQRSALERAKFPVEAVDDPNAVGMFRTSAPKKLVFTDVERTRRRAFALYQIPFILGMALSEAVALFGFILGFLGFPVVHVLPFWALCWALMAWRFPTEHRAFSALEQIYGATFTR